jgi:Major intrinsic protein
VTHLVPGAGMRIAAMTDAYATTVLAIYQAGIDQSHATFETRAPGWPDFTAGRLPGHRFVATVAGQVAGWVAASPVSGRCVYAVTISTKHRASPAHFLSEIIATLGLMLVIFALVRSGRARSAPAAVGAYIGAAYWFTSSTSFANPAITIGRMFSDTFAGIAPSSVPSFIAAQIVGGVLAFGVIKALYPDITPAEAADVIIPHDQVQTRPASARAAHDGTSPFADQPSGPAQPR